MPKGDRVIRAGAASMTTAVCLAALLAALPHAALAQSAELQAARDQVDVFEHGEALKHLEKVLNDPDAKPEDKATAHWLAATCHLALNKKKEMGAELDKLLALSPLYEPRDDEGPPEQIKEYRKRARKFRDDHVVTIGESTVAENVLSAPLEKNDKEAAAARVLLRAKGETAYEPAPLTVEGNKVSGPLGSEDFRKKAAAAGGVEYVVQTLSKGGMPNGQLGTEAAPKFLELAAPAPVKEETKPEAPKPEEKKPAVAKTGAGGKAIGVGVAMIVVGLLTGVAAAAVTAAGLGMFGFGVVQVNGARDGQPTVPFFDVFRILTNAFNVLGPSMGIASAVLLVFGVVVAVVLR